MKELLSNIAENATFVLEFLVIIACLVGVAYIAQKIGNKKRNVSERILSTKMIAVVGVFSAIAAILMLLEIPLPFAPSFYKIDASDIPALIGGYIMGPVAAVLIEFFKIVLHLVIKGTSTAFVGELANFLVGCSFLLPATIMYQFNKKKTTAILGCVVGTITMSVFGSVFNGIYLLPKFSELYGMALDDIVKMGSAVNGMVTNVTSLVLWAVFPLNLIKGLMISVVTVLIYKPISKAVHKIVQ